MINAMSEWGINRTAGCALTGQLTYANKNAAKKHSRDKPVSDLY